MVRKKLLYYMGRKKILLGSHLLIDDDNIYKYIYIIHIVYIFIRFIYFITSYVLPFFLNY
jgi:hypothetical protein